MTLTDAYAEDASTDEKIEILKRRLVDKSQSLAKRMRVVCSLRAIRGHETVAVLASCLQDESALFRHEIAYALGQMKDSTAIPILINTLRSDLDPMVRHEAAEALGAIAAPEAITVLKEFEHCDVEEVAQTCELALDRIRWSESKKADHSPDEVSENKFMTIDPAPPADPSLSVDDHIALLINPSAPLFQRYGSLFALRDLGTTAAVAGLCTVLLEDKSSALLRHEIAFVLGQIQNKSALSALESCLRNTSENQMVRHEAAEAAGAVLADAAQTRSLLEEFAQDENRVVAESCLVALDVADYWADDAQLHYADMAAPA